MANAIGLGKAVGLPTTVMVPFEFTLKASMPVELFWQSLLAVMIA
jgi:hypothetical protein